MRFGSVQALEPLPQPVRSEIQKGSHLQRQDAPRSVNEMDGKGDRFIGGQQDTECAVLDRFRTLVMPAPSSRRRPDWRPKLPPPRS
jgi:hypothetical protein